MYRFIWIFNWLKYFSLVEVMNQNYSEILMKKVHSSINEVASCTILKMIQWTWDHGERPGLKEDDSAINKLQLFLRQTLMLIDICNAWTLIDEKSIINKSLKKCIFIKGNGSWGLWPCMPTYMSSTAPTVIEFNGLGPPMPTNYYSCRVQSHGFICPSSSNGWICFPGLI